MPTISDREQEVLEFWEREKIFERSVSERPAGKPYTFYDGPPFATGMPHYGHLPSQFLKDAIPRYWTMKGYRVERRWGWDCHGLPIENIIEQKLGLKSKKDIEQFGIAKFNEECRATVLRYANEWKKTIHRLGRWIDMDHAYKTMDRPFMESVWWVFAELWKRGLIYEGKKAMHICPRCVTPLSNFEVTLGYKDVKDISVTAQFQLQNTKHLGIEGPIFALAWTTTPWTLPGNVLLAVGEDITYSILAHRDGTHHVIMAKERLASYEKQLKEGGYRAMKEVKGHDLIGTCYEPLFPYFKDTENAFRIVAADIVSTEDGTGIVHIAPAFGEDDYLIGEREKVGLVQHVTMQGAFTDDVSDFTHQEVKPIDDPSRADVEIVKWLAKNGKLFAKESITHSYPHCWRCDTPLLNYATSSWFVRVTSFKDELLKNNEAISWIPGHIKEGRFGKWLENARDWAISRNRYWGTPLPIWKSDEGDVICVGSISELESLCGSKFKDIHKHIIDTVQFEKDGKTYRRIPEVLDCWFESGSMPYGQAHYPFEHKEEFEKGFPAEFIAEGQDQTRGWFYTLHVLATALTRTSAPALPSGTSTGAFHHVIVNGIVLAEDGKKMSKRLNNYPDITKIIEDYGADAVRLYILSSPVVHAENLNFSEKSVRELYNKYINTLWNVFVFAHQFEYFRSARPSTSSTHILDRWILSRLAFVRDEVTRRLEKYEIAESIRPLLDYVSDLSLWYLRRSRERLKGDDGRDRADCAATLRMVLTTVAHLTAPFTPFLADALYRGINSSSHEPSSVHLCFWPDEGEFVYDEQCEREMETARSLVEMLLSLRAQAQIKIRQVLKEATISVSLSQEFLDIIASEVNIKTVHVQIAPQHYDKGWLSKEEKGLSVSLNTTLTDALREEGLVREFVRAINALRKDAGFTILHRMPLSVSANEVVSALIRNHAEQIKKQTLVSDIIFEDRTHDHTITIDDGMVHISFLS